MQKINSRAGLKLAIEQMELKQTGEWFLLKEEFFNAAESLKPVNLIKSSFKEAIAIPDLKTNIINAAIGLTTGVLAKKVILGRTLNPLSKLAGIILEMAVATKVTKNATVFRSAGDIIMKKIFNRHTDPEKTNGHFF